MAARNKIDFIEVPYALRGKNDRLTVNLVARDLVSTFKLLTLAARAVIGTRVLVAPFNGRVLARVGVWIEGDPDEVEGVLKKMREQ